MKNLIEKYFKSLIILLVLFLIYYLIIHKNQYERITNFTYFYSTANVTPHIEVVQTNTTTLTIITTTTTMITTVNRTFINNTTTTTISTPTTIDPALILVERPPFAAQLNHTISNITIAVFVFHTRHSVLANLQLHLVRKLAINLVAIELFLDGSPSEEMRQVAEKHKAGLYSLPENMHKKDAAPSDRNADVVNWALTTKAKQYLGNGSAILLLDGDVFPLSYFDATTLLNSHDLVCRKHPATYSRFCWIGFICLSPQIYNTIDDFRVSVLTRRGNWHDAGGQTLEYLLKYPSVSFSWMKETILLHNDSELFWGAINTDINWIEKHFDRCDKCGPEIFFSSFNTSDAIFYHMISGTSEWRFGDQISRRQSFLDSILKSPYGIDQNISTSELSISVRKIQNMQLIPFYGNLTCEKICKKRP